MRSPRRRARPRPSLVVVLAVLAISATACSNMSGSLSTRVRQWASSAGYSADDAQVEADLAGMAAGIRLHDLIGLRTDCAAFGADVEAIYGELPTPDATLNNELNTAIDTDWYPAAEKCYAASSFTSADYRAFAVKFHAGGLEYAKAKRLLASFGVR